MTLERLEQLSRLHRPHVDLKRVAGARADHLAGRLDGDAPELGGCGRHEGLEVAVAHHVKRTNGAVEGRGHEGATVRYEGDVGHGCRVLCGREDGRAHGQREGQESAVGKSGGRCGEARGTLWGSQGRQRRGQHRQGRVVVSP